MQARRLVVGALFAAVVAASQPPLAAAAPSTGAHPAVDEAQLALAKLNLLLFMISNIPEPGSAGALAVPCPLLRPDQVGALVGQQGLVPDLASFEGVTAYHDDEIGSGVNGIVCGQVGDDSFFGPVDPAAPVRVSLDAFMLDDTVTFDEAVESVTGGTVLVTDVPGIGGQLGGHCRAVGDTTFCSLEWYQDDLVLGLFTFGPTVQVNDKQSQQLLISMVQPIIDNLVAYEVPAGDTTTTVLPVAPTTTLAPAVVTTTPAPAGPTTTLKTLGG